MSLSSKEFVEKVFNDMSKDLLFCETTRIIEKIYL